MAPVRNVSGKKSEGVKIAPIRSLNTVRPGSRNVSQRTPLGEMGIDPSVLKKKRGRVPSPCFCSDADDEGDLPVRCPAHTKVGSSEFSL